MEDKDKTFVVKDRRFFDESGETRAEAEAAPAEGAPAEKPASGKPAEEPQGESEAAEAAEQRGPAGRGEEEALPEVSFAGFIISLSTTAMFHFGDFADPQTGKGEKNLAAAKQMIDMLGMLKEKTLGNLDDNERNLLDGILYDLRLRYVREKTGT
jgi:hypothetical protein